MCFALFSLLVNDTWILQILLWIAHVKINLTKIISVCFSEPPTLEGMHVLKKDNEEVLFSGVGKKRKEKKRQNSFTVSLLL